MHNDDAARRDARKLVLTCLSGDAGANPPMSLFTQRFGAAVSASIAAALARPAP